mgnify:CR=1 FL=1
MNSIKNIVDLISNNNNINLNLWHYLGDFLDYFYSSDRTTEERFNLVLHEPIIYDALTKKDYAFLAGTVHKVCHDYHVRPPEWVIKDDYFLERPYFSVNAKGNLRLVLLIESPPEFRMRNIFTSENTLDRV